MISTSFSGMFDLGLCVYDDASTIFVVCSKQGNVISNLERNCLPIQYYIVVHTMQITIFLAKHLYFDLLRKFFITCSAIPIILRSV